MTNYARMYRFGITPWERYGTVAAASITALLDREETGRSRPLGRASTSAAAAASIEAAAAKSRGVDGLSYVVGDVTRLPPAHLGTFDFFLDIGCFQGLDAEQRLSQGRGVSALANPGATLLLLSFGPSRWRSFARRRIAGGRRDRLRGLADARRRARGHRGPGLADEQDRAAAVQAAPTDLERRRRT